MQTHLHSIGTLLASFMSRMTKLIAIEDDNVIFHVLQVLVIGNGSHAVIDNSDG